MEGNGFGTFDSQEPMVLVLVLGSLCPRVLEGSAVKIHRPYRHLLELLRGNRRDEAPPSIEQISRPCMGLSLA